MRKLIAAFVLVFVATAFNASPALACHNNNGVQTLAKKHHKHHKKPAIPRS